MAKIIYFGNEQLAQGIKAKTPIFDALLDNDYEIVALILPTANTRKPFPIDLKAKANHIPVHYTKDTSEILNIINQTQPDIGILAAFSKFIPTSILEAIPNGIINIHPSLLPKYRGTTPIESALLNGDELAGVSVMRLVKAMDAGPTYAQGEVKITDQTTKQSLYEHLANLGAKLLIDVLPGILAKTAPESLQDDTQATFTTPLDKSLSLLKTDSKSAQELVCEVKAFAGFPKSKLNLCGKNCTITAAHSANQPKSELDQLCADGKYLIIDQLIPENSKPMTAEAFLNGLKNQ